MSTERISSQLQFDFGKNFISNPKKKIANLKVGKDFAIQTTAINSLVLTAVAIDETFGQYSKHIALTLGLGLLGMLFHKIKDTNKKIQAIKTDLA